MMNVYVSTWIPVVLAKLINFFALGINFSWQFSNSFLSSLLRANMEVTTSAKNLKLFLFNIFLQSSNIFFNQITKYNITETVPKNKNNSPIYRMYWSYSKFNFLVGSALIEFTILNCDPKESK